MNKQGGLMNTELIKALRETRYDSTKLYHVMVDYCHAVADRLEAADKRVKEPEEAQRWIPVEERLPGEVRDGSSADCLIAIRYAYDLPNEKQSLCAGYLLDGEWWAYMDHDCHIIEDGDTVTHWQKLPQPPQKG